MTDCHYANYNQLTTMELSNMICPAHFAFVGKTEPSFAFFIVIVVEILCRALYVSTQISIIPLHKIKNE
jgi:hypothetical protein